MQIIQLRVARRSTGTKHQIPLITTYKLGPYVIVIQFKSMNSSSTFFTGAAADRPEFNAAGLLQELLRVFPDGYHCILVQTN